MRQRFEWRVGGVGCRGARRWEDKWKRVNKNGGGKRKSTDALGERGEQTEDFGRHELASDSPITRTVGFASVTENRPSKMKSSFVGVSAGPPSNKL